ncbi:MAG: PilW family protein [Rhodanobacter sp.]
MTLPIRSRYALGFTLIELLVAMVLGLLVTTGIITVFISTSSSNRAQTQLATLQEAGRFAVTQLKNDLSMANGQYCSNTGGNASPSTAGPYLDGLRTPTVYAAGSALTSALNDSTTPWGSAPYPAAPAASYSLPSFMSMRGYDCTTTACTPMDPSSAENTNGFSIPAMGTTVGSRVAGAAVLTVRYINPASGWAIMPPGSATGSTMVSNANGTLSITLSPLNTGTAAAEPPAANFLSGDLAMLADCSNAQVFTVALSSGVLTSAGTGTTTGYNYIEPNGQQGMAAPKLFDFNRDYQTVTYYLKVVNNGDGNGHTTGALMRRVNGGTTNATHNGSENELVRGVERMDFLYGVEYPDGTIRYLHASDVDASNSTTPGCMGVMTLPINGSTDPGCLWRAVTSIQIDLLVDGQIPLFTLLQNDMKYTYATDGVLTPTEPGTTGSTGFSVSPTQQGFVNQMIRREFTAVVSVRNFNP